MERSVHKPSLNTNCIDGLDVLFQVSYHDVPDRAYETFVSALTSKYLEQGLVIPTLVDVHNPAGMRISC